MDREHVWKRKHTKAGHFAAAKEVQFYMDRSFEDLRHEVLELDRESQGKLVGEIEQQWSAEIDDEAYAEAARCLDAYRRGEATAVSAEESMAHVHQIIEDYKKPHS